MKFLCTLTFLAVLAVCQINAEYSEEKINVLGDPVAAEVSSEDLSEVSEGDSSELAEMKETFGLRRAKRATCDLLSGFKINHSACAAHCILKRYKGGYCNSKAICVCRN